MPLKLFIIFSEQSSIILIISLSLEPENKGDNVCLKIFFRLAYYKA